jgi:hypothetical protein
MTTEQKNVVHYMIGAALEDAKNKAALLTHSSDGSKDDTRQITMTKRKERRMTRNLFEQQNGGKKEEKHVLTHDAIKGIVEDAHKMGSLKESVEALCSQARYREHRHPLPGCQDRHLNPGVRRSSRRVGYWGYQRHEALAVLHGSSR